MDDLSNVCGVEFGETAGRSEEEFEELLTSIGWDASYFRTRISASPEAPRQAVLAVQEVPGPETDNPIPSPESSRGLVFRLVFVLILVLCVVFRGPLEGAAARGWAHFSGQSQLELRANFLLTQAHFLSLQPGTSAEEVRDRVGLPGSRALNSALGGQEDWYYTAEATGTKGQDRFYVVSMSNGKVVLSLDITELRSSKREPNPQTVDPQYYGDLKIILKGKRHLLHASDERATVVIGPSIDSASLSDLAVPVLQPERLAVARTGDLVSIPPVALYWHGVLHPLPAPHPDISPKALVEDLNWLFKGLGCDETGRTLLPTKRASSDPR